MKKVIRLTESDLTRIVRRILKESSSEVVKVKAWTSREDRDKLAPRSYNLNITNLRLSNNMVEFDYTLPTDTTMGEMPKKGFGNASCGNVKDNSIGVDMNGRFKFLFLTREGHKKVTKLCDSYVSNDTEMDGDYA
jgi:hypothetical protein